MSDGGLIGVDARLAQLANDGEEVLGYAPASETDAGIYFIVLRHYDHPDVDSATVLNVRYAYLTRGSGSDGWVDNGINMRIEGDPQEFMQSLARLFANASGVGPGSDPVTADLRGE